MKQSAEYLRGLCYKLQMFGILVDELLFIYGDNQSVLVNELAMESTLKKKSESRAFHFIHQVCETGEWRMTYITTSLNVSDLMKKPLSGKKQWCFVRIMLHHI